MMPKELGPPQTFLGRELEEIPTLDGSETFFIFKSVDDKTEFPANGPASTMAGYASSGMAIHGVRLEPKEDGSHYRLTDRFPFMASKVQPFREDDFLFECWSVLQAHDWIPKRGLPRLEQRIIDQVTKEIGTQIEDDARQTYGTEWEWFIAEVAVAHFVEPLSRLWYAASMLSLYLAHQDDLSTAYFWAEYRMRLDQEANSLRGATTVQAASKGGLERSRGFGDQRAKVLTAMQRHVEKGHSASRAAELAANEGLGTSASANAKLWTRNRRK